VIPEALIDQNIRRAGIYSIQKYNKKSLNTSISRTSLRQYGKQHADKTQTSQQQRKIENSHITNQVPTLTVTRAMSNNQRKVITRKKSKSTTKITTPPTINLEAYRIHTKTPSFSSRHYKAAL